MKRVLLCALTTLVAVAPLACATSNTGGAARSTSNSNIVSAGEIELAGPGGSVFELIRRIRPLWLSTGRGFTGNNNAGNTKASFDGGQLLAAESLDQVPLKDVREIRLLSGTEATQRYGTLSGGGAVIMVMRK